MTKNYPYFTIFHILISSSIVSLIPVLKDLNLISVEISALVRLKTCNEDLPKTYNSLWFAIYCVILPAFYLYCSNLFSLILKNIGKENDILAGIKQQWWIWQAFLYLESSLTSPFNKLDEWCTQEMQQFRQENSNRGVLKSNALVQFLVTFSSLTMENCNY